MNERTIDSAFPQGLLRTELFIGAVCSVNASSVSVTLAGAERPSGSHFSGGRYGRGEVGEFVLIEGQLSLLLGRIAEVHLIDGKRQALPGSLAENRDLQAQGSVKLLGQVSFEDLRATAGVDVYPRIGDRVYSAPHKLLAMLPQLMEREGSSAAVTLSIGAVEGGRESQVHLTPERLFGRHCAILGATGGGKSWTTARVIEECLKFESKLILIDATGEYRGLSGSGVRHHHLGHPVEEAKDSVRSSLPPHAFQEPDFIALFEPAGKVQGPKLKAAIRSLRLAMLCPELAPSGFIRKIDQPKAKIEAAEREESVAKHLDNPRQPFDVTMLPKQIEQECVYPDGYLERPAKGKDPTKWGTEDGNFSYCLSLIARINGVVSSSSFECVFKPGDSACLTDAIDDFVNSADKLLRICLSGVGYEYQAREIIANVIGRHLLLVARSGKFRNRPTVVLVDEAHNFLGRRIGSEDHIAKLDAFEFIAKEGRKYGLNICLASQRPRDITEGVLSQMGTLIVHRLTNDHDREVVERACGEIDRAASAFLPNLRPGEAVIIGTDFPIPLTIAIQSPVTKPFSDGPKYQEHWKTEEKAAVEAPIPAPAKAMSAGS